MVKINVIPLKREDKIIRARHEGDFNDWTGNTLQRRNSYEIESKKITTLFVFFMYK